VFLRLTGTGPVAAYSLIRASAARSLRVAVSDIVMPS
jgi:hypothetical protein